MRLGRLWHGNPDTRNHRRILLWYIQLRDESDTTGIGILWWYDIIQSIEGNGTHTGRIGILDCDAHSPKDRLEVLTR